MPDYASSIYLGGHSNIEGLEYRLTCLKDRVAVVMDEKDVSEGGILLPMSGRLNPDTGTVIASGVKGLEVGTRVCVRPYDNQGIHGAWFYDFQGQGRLVRFFGVADDWHTSIVATLGFQDRELTPTFDWVLVQREDGSLGELDIRTRYANRGKIVGAGYWAFNKHVNGKDYATGLELGQTVDFLAPDPKNKKNMSAEVLDFNFGADKSLALIRARRIQAVIHED
jgi:hypothetical protein